MKLEEYLKGEKLPQMDIEIKEVRYAQAYIEAGCMGDTVLKTFSEVDPNTCLSYGDADAIIFSDWEGVYPIYEDDFYEDKPVEHWQKKIEATKKFNKLFADRFIKIKLVEVDKKALNEYFEGYAKGFLKK